MKFIDWLYEQFTPSDPDYRAYMAEATAILRAEREKAELELEEARKANAVVSGYKTVAIVTDTFRRKEPSEKEFYGITLAVVLKENGAHDRSSDIILHKTEGAGQLSFTPQSHPHVFEYIQKMEIWIQGVQPWKEHALTTQELYKALPGMVKLIKKDSK